MAEGWNKSTLNPTWHGEIDAINRLAGLHADFAGGKLIVHDGRALPDVVSSVLWSGIEMVVFGTSIRFLQENGWRQIDILAEEVVRRSPTWRRTVIGGVLEEDCNALSWPPSGLAFAGLQPNAGHNGHHSAPFFQLHEVRQARGFHGLLDDADVLHKPVAGGDVLPLAFQAKGNLHSLVFAGGGLHRFFLGFTKVFALFVAELDLAFPGWLCH